MEWNPFHFSEDGNKARLQKLYVFIIFVLTMDSVLEESLHMSELLLERLTVIQVVRTRILGEKSYGIVLCTFILT
jgi:hypothetical protein